MREPSPAPKQSIHSLINFIKWFATGNMHFLPRGFPRPVVPSPAVTGERVWGGGGICPPTSACLLPSILLTTISAKGSTRLPPGLLPQPCPLSLGWLPASAAAPPPPPPRPASNSADMAQCSSPHLPGNRAGEERSEWNWGSLHLPEVPQHRWPLPWPCSQRKRPSLAHLSPTTEASFPLPICRSRLKKGGCWGGVSVSGVHNWANGVQCKYLCGRWR